LYYIGAELLEQATHKVEEVTNQANAVAADTAEKVEGKYVHFQRGNSIISFIYMSRNQTRCTRTR